MTKRPARALISHLGLTLLLALLFPMLTSAQTFRGTILGTVTDASGAAVPGATVAITNTDTGLVRTTTTSGDGSYTVP